MKNQQHQKPFQHKQQYHYNPVIIPQSRHTPPSAPPTSSVVNEENNNDDPDVRPMEFDATTRVSLAFKEKQRRKNLRLCAYCGGDHQIKTCLVIPPTRTINTVYSTANPKPKGDTKVFTNFQHVINK